MNKEMYLKTQAAKLTAGHIDRRQFIMSAIAAGIVLPTAMSMATNAMAMTPKKGGDAKFGSGFGSTTDSMDPGTYENSFMTFTGFMYGNCLTVVAANGKLEPE
ncbi:MAG: peptide ABC transporter substrate-binding protein, partial [Salaquimonas sp.]